MLEIRFRGVRGSTPVTDEAMLGYGGNTSCVEVRTSRDQLLILDAGTGLTTLSPDHIGQRWPEQIEIFLTHFHIDHLQGLPYFAPLRIPECRVRIHAPRQDGIDLEAVLGHRLAPIYFPVPLTALGCQLEFRRIDSGEPFEVGDVTVDSLRVNHPSVTHAYRVRSGGVTLAYVPDNELGSSGARLLEKLSGFCSGADLLIHDAMYTDHEYPTRRNWGHSTYGQATELAMRARVRALCFFHHAPERSDSVIDDLVERERQRARSSGASIQILAAREGHTVSLQPATDDRIASARLLDAGSGSGH